METYLSAVAYMRCSGASQVDGDTWMRQITAIMGWCQSKYFELIHEYREEAVPGKLDEEHRPAFQQMVSDLLGNGCRTIVIEGMSRLAREYRTQEHLIIYLASKGLTLISADTGEDITAAMMGDPMRRALVQIQGIFSELDKNLLVAKLAKARQRKKELTGKGTGRHAFGEKPEEVETLALILELRKAGETCEQIASTLTARGLKSRMGVGWKRGTIAKIIGRETLKPNSAIPAPRLR